MTYLEIITILICLTASFAYLNARFLMLPSTIGLMMISLIFSAVLGLIHFFDPTLIAPFISFIVQLDFSEIVFNLLLSFLLFAGALHTDFKLLHSQKRSIVLFSIVGVLISAFLTGGVVYGLTSLCSMSIPFIYCLLFGATVTPTDPIAILGVLTKLNMPKKLEINIVGESLFNDGIGVVLFSSILLAIQHGSAQLSPSFIVTLFLKEAIGGCVFGLGLGYMVHLILDSIDDYEAEILITIALVLGGSLIANFIHISAPLAMIVAGLFIGHRTKIEEAEHETERFVDKFWHIVDVVLNAILFVLVGLKLLVINLESINSIISIFFIPLFICIRFISLYLPFIFTKRYLEIRRKDIFLMTWGGLRGGLSIAMVLSLSSDLEFRNLFITMTYAVVIFSILVQGLTVERFINKFYK